MKLSPIKCSIKSSQNNVRVGVLGASGYTGSEVISLHSHSHINTSHNFVELWGKMLELLGSNPEDEGGKKLT